MDYREFMSYAPGDLKPTIFNPSKEIQKSEEEMAKAKGKKLQNLTEDEKDAAMNSIGLCDLDFWIP